VTIGEALVSCQCAILPITAVFGTSLTLTNWSSTIVFDNGGYTGRGTFFSVDARWVTLPGKFLTGENDLLDRYRPF
jgi:hypothetical protein